MNFKKEIRQLAKSKNALILAHNYQNEDIQDIADATGDSLELAKIAAKNSADIIVFCGVHFMAESAAILAPDKKVLLPEKSAGCPMADMADIEAIKIKKEQYPEALVITYINSSADVKSVSDICCTSSNALNIIKYADAKQIIFVPDKNLGNYVSRFTDKEIILWDGYCPVHDMFTAEQFSVIKRKYPDAVSIVHPECRPEIIDMADEVLSTGNMIKYVKKTACKNIIVGTENGMIYKLKTEAPDKNYITAKHDFICPDMKKITQEKLFFSLRDEVHIIKVENETAQKARNCLLKMLELSQ